MKNISFINFEQTCKDEMSMSDHIKNFVGWKSWMREKSKIEWKGGYLHNPTNKKVEKQIESSIFN